MGKLKTKNITINEYLTVAQVKTIPAVTKEWLMTDEDYTLDNLINDQTIMFAKSLPESNYSPEVIKIEKLEWVGNWKGRKNNYNTDITVWVTAVVDLGRDKIVRLSYDLFDSMIMTSESGCSGVVR